MISSPGIGSGLDINRLVTQLVAAEGQPASLRLAQDEANAQAQISAFGSLKSALSTFADSIDALSKLTTFQARTATSNDLTLFTATAESNAAIASYNLEVVNLAESHKLVSKGFAGTSTVVGSGTITIGAGTKVATIGIASGTDTLADIRDAIDNASGSTGVSATIIAVDDGMGGTVSKLLLSSDDTGTANNITVTVGDDDLNDLDDAGLSQLVFDPAGSGTTRLTEATPVSDAQIKVDGQTITSSSNTIADAIEGVTINLVSENPGSVKALTVTRDTSSITSLINDFVTNFNAFQETVDNLTSFDAETGARGTLLGNATVLTINNQIRRELTDAVLGASSAHRTLSDIGIRTELDGSLSVDSTVLDAALASDPDAVGTVFTSFDGIATNLDEVVEDITASDGSIETKITGLNATLDDIEDARDALNVRLAAFEARLFAQFNAMDQLVAQLQTTSNFLTQQLTLVQSFALKNQQR